MSRPVQPSDIATVNVNGREFSLIISSIDDRGIHAGDYLIIPSGDQWQVQNYNSPHSITFTESTGLSGISDLDMTTLLFLELPDLDNACLINPRIQSLCQSDNFWKLKMERDYPEAIPYKPADITNRKEYRTLVNVKDPNRAANEGRLDQLIVLEKRGLELYIGLAHRAAEHGHVNVLEWLSQRNILPRGADLAAENGHLNVLKWMETKNILPSPEGAYEAAVNGHVAVLEWLATKHILPDKAAIQIAAEKGYYDVVDFAIRMNLLRFPSFADLATENEDMNLLEWLAQRGILPSSKAADNAYLEDRQEITTWLAQKGIRSTFSSS